ncbi:hypothetical protein MKZ38_003589 [Zalerion maritima]|uniref:Uncharacterized protein n=1 Tax=Zalerion maritima TaxID=339359 RepID=A0AAD5WQ55_9PEZI|nr:hypothetical protein MKZ38_003589 [Zalerion maritima]
MAVKTDGLEGYEQEIPLQIPSRFDNLFKEDTADIFDDLVVESDSEDAEADSPSIAPATERQRNRAFRAWKHPKFWGSIWKAYPNANAEQVWVDLCKNDPTAFRICKAFLKFYEYVMERAVKSARSLNAFWKSLIAAADAEVLAPLRRKSSENYQLVLKRPKNYLGSADEAPVSKISH